MKFTERKKAFSILEMVIVLGVAIILFNIAFSFYNIHLRNTRDNEKLQDISKIQLGLNNLLSDSYLLPKSFKGVDITFSGQIINNQGYLSPDYSFGADTFKLRDYTYTTNKERTKFQISSLLENNWSEKDDINYKKLLPYSVGSDLGVLLREQDNLPVQEFSSETIDTDSDLEGYIAYINNDKYAIGNDIKTQMAFRINPTANCLHILKNGESHGDGIYTISPDEKNTFDVYCDMTTDGGGWTMFYANNGIEDSPISESYVDMRENVFSGQVYDLTDYSGATLAGLLDYRLFTKNGAREVLLKNTSVTDQELWGEVFFDSANTLEWALGDEVLGTGIEKCINLPEGATWGVRDNQGKANFFKLTQMMAHGGTSWGISHEKFDCNGYTSKSVLPHMAFYVANNDKTEGRARSNMLVGGSWGGENQYRYFIR